MIERPLRLSFWAKFWNIVLGLITLGIGIRMICTQYGSRGSFFGTFTIEGPLAVVAGVAFSIWGVSVLVYTFRRIARERDEA